MTIDAHHHFWNPARIPQQWMTAEDAAIARAFEPEDLAPCLGSAGVTKTVLVQSAARDDDTDYMFELAGDVAWVGAIIAWCSLADEARARARLDELLTRPKLRGIRHLIHLEPDPHWILQPAVAAALSMLEEASLILELPAVFPDHLGDVAELARRHPGLTLVVDHLGKPPLATPQMGRWEELLCSAAEQPNVYAKISGLNTMAPTETWSAADLEPAVRVAVDAFGPARLVIGSDWPVALLNGDYLRVWRETAAAVERAAGPHAALQIKTRTPETLYRLER